MKVLGNSFWKRVAYSTLFGKLTIVSQFRIMYNDGR